MAKNKKRGFFSWLGLGREDKTPQEEVKETLPAAPADLPDESASTPLATAEERAGETVETTEAVARQQAQEAENARLAAEAAHEAELAHAAAEAAAAQEAENARMAAEAAAARQAESIRLATEAAMAQYEEGVRLAVEVANREAELIRAAAEAAEAQEVENARLAAEAAAREAELARVAAEAAAAQEAENARLAAEAAAREAELARVAAEAAAAQEAENARLAEEAAAREAELAEAAAAALAAEQAEQEAELARAKATQEQSRPTKEGFFARLKRSLVKTRQNLGSGFISLFRGKKIDDDLFEELEEQLLIADVGVETTRRIIENLTAQANRKQLRDAEALYGLLKTEMSGILSKVDAPLDVSGKTPFVILMVGVNGVGKTTTIGKLARQFQAEGKSVMLAAGDTFRAAAVEQLQVWGERNHIPVVAQHTGADSASVIFDAIQAAKARNVDVLIADTAGRLQNKSHLMEELKKITRVMKKLDEQAPHEVMLTIDASTGQNAISQTKLFHEAVGLTGITLTKLDGTAKGGVIFSVADQFGIPIRYIGVGEGIEDLRSFKADDFIEALFAREE